MMNWARELRSTTRAAQCMWVELSMKRDERTHIVPEDTIFSAPLGNSFGLLHSPMPIICGTRSSDHLIHHRPHSWHRRWWGSMQVNYLERRQFTLKSCRLLTQEKIRLFRQGLVYSGSYFLWYLIRRPPWRRCQQQGTNELGTQLRDGMRKGNKSQSNLSL